MPDAATQPIKPGDVVRYPGHPRFWSDDFDMDLPQVVPDVFGMLGDDATRTVWTVGKRTHGRLNHPVTWNTHGAFVWLTKPNLSRDQRGWFNVDGCVSNDEEIECTWLELLRDAWPHGYAVVLLPERITLRPAPQRAFDRIMWDRRGRRKQDTSDAVVATVDWVMTWHEQLTVAAENARRAEEKAGV